MLVAILCALSCICSIRGNPRIFLGLLNERETETSDKAQSRLFLGGGEKEDDSFYDYGFDPYFDYGYDFGGHHGSGGHHFMDRNIREQNGIMNFSIRDFLVGLLNLRRK